MLPELFQDDEKAISPTSATSSGRVPLTRIPSKPTKGRPGQTAKEHKKTVGHQVSSGAVAAVLASLMTQREPQVFLCQPPRWGPQVTRGWSAPCENVELCPFTLPCFSSHIVDPWPQTLCPKSFFLHFNSSSAHFPSQTTAAFVLASGCFLSGLGQLPQPRNPAPHSWCLVHPGVGNMTDRLCARARAWALGRRPCPE